MKDDKTNGGEIVAAEDARTRTEAVLAECRRTKEYRAAVKKVNAAIEDAAAEGLRSCTVVILGKPARGEAPGRVSPESRVAKALRLELERKGYAVGGLSEFVNGDLHFQISWA